MTPTQPVGTAQPMEVHTSDSFARLALKLDGWVTGLNGIGYLALATVLDSFFGFDTAIQYPIGVFLLVYGAGVLVLGTRETINRNGLGLVCAANLGWVVLSLVVLVTGVLTPTEAGQIWLILQALVVAAFAALQYVGLKRM